MVSPRGPQEQLGRSLAPAPVQPLPPPAHAHARSAEKGAGAPRAGPVAAVTNIARGYCFYVDLRNNDIARTLSKRIEDLGLRQELFLTESVTHVISDRACGSARASGERPTGVRRRADAMLERVRDNSAVSLAQNAAHASGRCVTLSVQKAVILLDKIYDTLYQVVFPQTGVKILKGEFIKFEPLDRSSRPVFKEFPSWPDIPKEPEVPPPPRDKREEGSNPLQQTANLTITPDDRMTKKNHPRIKEDTKEIKGGYCEMCNTDYLDAALHRRSPHHLAFVRNSNNFRSLDSLIEASTDVAAFLDKNAPHNGERRSLRKLCNGDSDPKSKNKDRSQTPEQRNGAQSPLRTNGVEEISKKRATRCRKRSSDRTEERQYYKVVGVSTKLRSSGGFAAPRQDSPPPTCNGTPGLVVKFRKVRRSELSVLSDEAEQFMFPRRTSTSSSSEEDEEPPPVPPAERRRSARPTALKEESSEEDSSHEYRQRRKRAPLTKKSRLAVTPASVTVELPVAPAVVAPAVVPPVPEVVVPVAVQEEAKEKCLKWEDGRLKAAPIVEELQFAFESVPNSEPWYETFTRQDQDKQISRNIPRYFAMYTTSPKLPYEIGQLPPLKPNCCILSDLVKREEKTAVAGPSRSYGTRGNKMQRIRKRTAAALIALEKHPRKSPREHASTLAILGGLLHRRKPADDTKSTASEDTLSDANGHVKSEPPAISQVTEQSQRLQQFLSEVYEDADECEVPEDILEGEAMVATSVVADVVSLVSECENCDIIRDEVREGVAARGTGRRGHRLKKKNRTGWPNKKKAGNRQPSPEEVKAENVDGEPSTEANETVEESTLDSASEVDESTIASADDMSVDEKPSSVDEKSSSRFDRKASSRSDRKTSEHKGSSEGEASADEGAKRWEDASLQPVVRVAKIDVSRKLRSAGRARGTARRSRAYRFR